MGLITVTVKSGTARSSPAESCCDSEEFSEGAATTAFSACGSFSSSKPLMYAQVAQMMSSRSKENHFHMSLYPPKLLMLSTGNNPVHLYRASFTGYRRFLRLTVSWLIKLRDETESGNKKCEGKMPPARFERTAPGLGILCSIHLSYGGTRKIS